MYTLPDKLNDRMIPAIRQDVETARGEILSTIAETETGRKILTELMKPDSYVPTGEPGIVMRLYRGPDGLYLGHAHGADGKILGHARWIKVSGTASRLLTSAGMLTGQLMLVEISQKLQRIQGSIDKIGDALKQDRMQKFRSAIEGTMDAIEAKRDENRQLLLTSTIPHLSEAVLQVIATLKREISEIPVPKDWHVMRAVVRRERHMRKSIAEAEQTFRACLEGISLLGQAYIAIGEPALGYRSVIRCLKELQQAGLETVEFRARLIEPTHVDDRPELIWGTFRQQLPELVRMVETERDRQSNDPFEIELRLTDTQIEAAIFQEKSI
jgi:hypothetical protein